MAMEIEECRHAPRVRLPGGALMRPRRTVLTADVQRLKRKRGLQRFCAWQALARELGWPERLRVSVGGGEPTPMHRDSPLAVEAIFKGVGPDTPYITVGEAVPSDSTSVPGHGTHMTELVFPFARLERCAKD